MTTQPSTPKYLNAKQAAAQLHITLDHLKQLTRKGKIKAIKGLVKGTNIPTWLYDPEDLKAYTPKAGVGHRQDGRNKYNIYLTPEELELLAKTFPALEVKRANPTKSQGEDEDQDQEIEELAA